MQSMTLVAMSTALWKPEGHVGTPQVVVDGFGQADNVDAVLRKQVCGLVGAVAAQNDQTVGFIFFAGFQHLFQSGLAAVFLRRQASDLNGWREVPQMVPPSVRMPEKSLRFILRMSSSISPRYPSPRHTAPHRCQAAVKGFATPRKAELSPTVAAVVSIIFIKFPLFQAEFVLIVSFVFF